MKRVLPNGKMSDYIPGGMVGPRLSETSKARYSINADLQRLKEMYIRWRSAFDILTWHERLDSDFRRMMDGMPNLEPQDIYELNNAYEEMDPNNLDAIFDDDHVGISNFVQNLPDQQVYDPDKVPKEERGTADEIRQRLRTQQKEEITQ